MQLTFLGTSCMVPTKERNQQAFFIKQGTEGILIDCGEGTQRQLKLAGIPLTKITKILISHWHGDHTFGLPGVLQSMASSEYTKTLKIYGPKETTERINLLFRAFPTNKKIKMEIMEIKKGIFFENKKLQLHAFPLDHNIDCFGYAIVERDKRRISLQAIKKLKIPEGPLLGKLQDNETIIWQGKKITPEMTTTEIKGKKIGIIPDTKLCNGCYDVAENADLLICESTYTNKLEKKAKKYFHMTSKEAALIANKANVKELILTHFSTRYKNTQELEEEARNFFDNVRCAKDFMKINL